MALTGTGRNVPTGAGCYPGRGPKKSSFSGLPDLTFFIFAEDHIYKVEAMEGKARRRCRLEWGNVLGVFRLYTLASPLTWIMGKNKKSQILHPGKAYFFYPREIPPGR